VEFVKIFDISMSIRHDMAVYKNKEEKRPEIKILQDFSNATSYESYLGMSVHTGTHIDMPLHMVENGATMEYLDLNKVITKCKVFDLSEVSDRITKLDLMKKDISAGDFILLKTKNSFSEEFENEFIYLDKSGAQYLKEKGISGVGTDGLGIERAQPDHETHKQLFASEIVIIEGLRLSDIEEGEYSLIALPIRIEGVEASPARVVLIKD
jgi:arylformamidase